MPLIPTNAREMEDGTKISSYSDTVGPSFVTFTLENQQESFTIKNKGLKPIVYTVGSTSNVTVNPGEKSNVTTTFSSFQVKSNEGIQEFEVVMDELGDVFQTPGLKSLNAQLAENSLLTGFLEGVVVSILKYEDMAVDMGGGLLDWKPVFDYMQSQALTCFVPYGTWDVYSRISPRRIIGVGRQRSIINQKTLSEPVIETNGIVYFTDFRIQHDSVPSSETIPNGAGILIINMSDGSVVERLEISNVTSGICLTGTGHVYSSSIRDIRITNFSHSATYIGGSGHTGSVWQNLYAVNWLDYGAQTKREATYGFYFKGINEGVYQQLNIEHGIYHNGVVFNDCANVNSIAMHYEGYVAKGSFNSLLYIDGSSTKNVDISGLTIVYSTFDGANFTNGYALMNLNHSPNIKISNVRTANNTLTGNPTLRKFFGAGQIAEGASIYANNITITTGEFSSSDYFPISPQVPILKQLNDTLYYWEESGKKRVVGSGVPATGKWNKGDKKIETNTSQGGYSEYICSLSGYFNPPSSSVTTTVPIAFVSDITVSSYGDFVVGDRITIVGSTRTFEITAKYVDGSNNYHFQLDKNIEVTVTNATVQYAVPVFENVGSVGGNKSGSLTYNGDGTATSKTIAHNLSASPTKWFVQAASVDAGTAGIKYVTADTTNLTVYFNTAPISGSNNVSLNWRAEI